MNVCSILLMCAFVSVGGWLCVCGNSVGVHFMSVLYSCVRLCVHVSVCLCLCMFNFVCVCEIKGHIVKDWVR